jgi:transmembrane sensor
MNYHDYTLQDFLNDDSFVQWVLFNTEDEYWQKILTELLHRGDIISEARQIIRQLKIEEERALFIDEERVLGYILANAVNGHPEPARVTNVSWLLKPWLRWAAVIFCFCGVGWLIIDSRFGHATSYSELVAEAEERSALTERVNTTGSPLKVTLEDGTVVTLQTNSRLSYPAHFGSDVRETFLSGEAFFEVAKNPKKPFYVYANEVVTKVLGTSFDIKAVDGDRQVSVNVRTGQVSVYSQRRISFAGKEPKGVVLSPNQQAVFDRRKESLSKQLVDEPMPLLPMSAELKRRYEEVPVATVLQELEQLYGIRMIYNKEVLSNCLITTMFGTEPLENKLDVVCETIGATHKEMDAQIIIESKGCR